MFRKNIFESIVHTNFVYNENKGQEKGGRGGGEGGGKRERE